ncbi:hypothetical protein PIB30_043186 [Stylosanthes scabra]|uniref:Uncharacterized protein n=1 Tax=Stylosanthes scabra TaxID=79078 RepID=A0ABU6VHP8_9FABA|nr:hypothetical protein [Stylosanthes scabra]
METKCADRRRRRYPLSDRTNSSSSSNNFNKPVTKCNSLLPPLLLCSGTHERRNNHNKAVVDPQQNVSNIRGEGDDGFEGLDLLGTKDSTVPCRKKQRCMSSQQKKSKNSQLQDFIEKQNAYYREVDDFVLSEEEVESIHELE